MTELDAAILDALHRALDKMKRDPEEAARRAHRAAHSIHRVPRSPWRLAIRAADTRIERACHIDHPETARARGAHGVLITCDSVLELCRPVRIPFPGIDWLVGADRLGISRTVMTDWIKKGVFHVSMCPARAAGKKGKPVPYIYSNSPLDPSAPFGRAPHQAWGTLWQYMADDIPVEHAWALRRHPEFTDKMLGFLRRPRAPGSPIPFREDEPTEHFIGWRWICPGRIRPIPEGMAPTDPPAPLDPDLELRRTGPLFADDYELTEPRIITIAGKLWLHTPCGRQVKMVYLPMRPWTVPDAEDLWDQLADFGIPPPPDYSAQPFACQQCWGLRTKSTLTASGWNDFIAYITGGVVYGSEVPRIGEEAQPRRIYEKHARRSPEGIPARRAEILRLILEGHSYAAIGRMMNLSRPTVSVHAKKLRADHNVKTRAELTAKLRPPTTAATAPGGAA